MSPSAPRSRVFTIPASVPFLPTLARALVSGELILGFAPADDPLALTRATIYLPTRRAGRLARDAFLDVMPADAALLPRILAIGDVDEDELAFANAGSADALDLSPALEGLQRRALLAQLVLKWADVLAAAAGPPPLIVNSPASALALADDLARLMDDMTTRQVSWDALDGLVPSELDQYWQVTLDFLKIAREAWPKILAEHNAIEPAERRDRLIEAEAARLAANSDGPVIAAGSTGSMPATAKLIATIARLPHGAVVLPGLDTNLDDESWKQIGGTEDDTTPSAGHPQFAMQALLQRMEIARGDVTVLAAPATHGRETLLSEALRPAATTDQWPQRLKEPAIAARVAAGLQNLTVIEAANAEEEALAIALTLREALEAPNTTAALVTPDRALARRVVATLSRWQIDADDSGGDPLAETAAGVFARLAAEVALGGLAPVALLALLKHPLLRLGAASGAHDWAVAALERAVLRGPRPRPGSKGLAHALDHLRGELDKLRRGEPSAVHRADPRASLRPAMLDTAAELVGKLGAALEPLEALDRVEPHALAKLAATHRAVIERLSADRAGESAVFDGNDGAALAAAFDEIETQLAGADLRVGAADYVEVFVAALSGRIVRRPGAPDARVHIYGPLEARLTNSDRVVLGGLCEGVWPPEVRSDAWLSRPMRHRLGLDLPERRIGLSAHDFAQLLGAKEVILTRSAKIGGAPTVPSRFLHRLAAVAGERWTAVQARGDKYLDWARNLDRPAKAQPWPRPEPKPPRAARPTSLSVTEIERWLRDPYTIYAKHVLRLVPLDRVDLEPTAADRGSAIHGAIGDFAVKFPELPADPYEALVALGKAHFAELEEFPEARAFWWPRFQRVARWFASWETGRRPSIEAIIAEKNGRIEFDVNGRTFALRARVDRIERHRDGRIVLLDYKTGRTPTAPEVKSGLAPQLTLEAAMVREGGFTDLPRGTSVDELTYVRLTGRMPGGEEKPVKFGNGTTPDSEADKVLRKLQGLVAKFEDDTTPYLSLLHPMWRTRYGDYDHLARVKEWQLAGEDDEGDGE